MPRYEDWAKNPNYKEYFIPTFDEGVRIRVGFVKEAISSKSKIKKVKLFSVGLEVQVKTKWKIVVRHCNYHEDSPATFHIHNPKLLPILGKRKRVKKKNQKKTPGSQMNWAIKNIRTNYNTYLKQYREKQDL